MSNSAPVIATTIAAKKGNIGHLQLNMPKALNSLNLEMVQLLNQQLIEWQSNDDIACIVLSGSGEKAFCAGGDVQALYKSAIETPGGPCNYAEQFFLEEYELDHRIHTYPKPLICIGSGIVMGGGLGLMAGASHRIVTETTRIAMPEVSIGLFPDVGGTRFLNDMPYGLGIFYALTGASINANDALFLNLADYFFTNEQVLGLMDQLSTIHWVKDPTKNTERLNDKLKKLCLPCEQSQQHAPSDLANYLESITLASQEDGLGDIIHALNTIDHDSPWLTRALKGLSSGSPLSSLLIYEQLRRFRYATLEETFEAELILATNMVRNPEFAEGVRALLIDKDKKPKWQYKHFSHVTATLMDSFYETPFEENPLISRLKVASQGA